MPIEEYFGDWSGIVDLGKAQDTIRRLVTYDQLICPDVKDVFKAFRLCPFHNLKCVVLSQDPYSSYRNGRPVATGLAFANSSDTTEENYSPSLKVLMESVIDFSMPHNRIIFDPSLESWEEQGVLLLNAALTCKKSIPNSHMLLWRPFITSFLTNLQKHIYGIVYILMGSSAQALEHYIDGRYNLIIRCRHPAWYARKHENMPTDIWKETNDYLEAHNGCRVKWYNEVKL